MRKRAAILLAVVFSASGYFPGAAQTPSEAVSAALARIEAARLLVAQAEQKPEKIEALSQALGAYEDGLGALRAGLRANSLAISALHKKLLVDEDRISRILAILQSLGGLPDSVDFQHPDGPLATVHAGLSLAATLPDMQRRVAALRMGLDDIAELNRLQEGAIAALRAGMGAAANTRAMLVSTKGDEGAGPGTAGALVAGLQGGESLAEIARLLTGGPTGATATANNPGELMPAPVQGRVLRAFNATDAAGIERPGIVMVSRRGAPVIAPAAATVRFAGAFPDYAHVVILEVRPGDLLVLAGLAVVLVSEGESVAAGEIVALLAGNSTANEDNLIAISKETGSNRQETLYIETRENGEPVDPAGWLDLPAQ